MAVLPRGSADGRVLVAVLLLATGFGTLLICDYAGIGGSRYGSSLPLAWAVVLLDPHRTVPSAVLPHSQEPVGKIPLALKAYQLTHR